MEPIKEAFIKRQTAILLQENGFDQITDYYYYKSIKKDVPDILSPYELNYERGNFIPAPTQQMTVAYIRQKYGIVILPTHNKKKPLNDGWGYTVTAYQETVKSPENYTSHEDAVEDAILYALENLL